MTTVPTVWQVSQMLGSSRHPTLDNVQENNVCGFYVAKGTFLNCPVGKKRKKIFDTLGEAFIAIKIIVFDCPFKKVRSLEAINLISEQEFSATCLLFDFGKVTLSGGPTFHWLEMYYEWLTPITEISFDSAVFKSIEQLAFDVTKWSIEEKQGFFDLSLRNIGIDKTGRALVFDYDDEGYEFGNAECNPMATNSNCLLHYEEGLPEVFSVPDYKERTERLAKITVTEVNSRWIVNMIYAEFLRTLHNAQRPCVNYSSVEDVSVCVKELLEISCESLDVAEKVRRMFTISRDEKKHIYLAFRQLKLILF